MLNDTQPKFDALMHGILQTLKGHADPAVESEDGGRRDLRHERVRPLPGGSQHMPVYRRHKAPRWSQGVRGESENTTAGNYQREGTAKRWGRLDTEFAHASSTWGKITGRS